MGAMKKDLGGIWQLRANGVENLSAVVPGCNYLDLLNNNLIADPFYGLNESKSLWLCEKDWTYSRDFDISAQELQNDKILLVFESIDTVSNIYINGTLLGKTDNCYIKYEFDVKPFLQEGKNFIEVVILSPVNYVIEHQKREKCPHNMNGLTGIPHIRKPLYHFGWDWGPVLTPSGISGDVYLQFYRNSRIVDVRFEQHHFRDKVLLNVRGDIERFNNEECLAQVTVSFCGDVIKQAECIINDSFDVALDIVNPHLWQTHEWSGLSSQNLYNVEIAIIQNGEKQDYLSRKIGLRTIELNRERDEYGTNFQFVLNGQPLFAKGADWIPADSFINRVDRAKLEVYIRTAVESGFNMIRVWGGGYYESDDFYDLCDIYGILVWQDFAFACQPYPFFNDDFRESTLEEVRCNVQRIRHHASLCLWCGNNEIEVMSVPWRANRKFVKWTEKYFYDILPSVLKEYDNSTPYIEGSPLGASYNRKLGADNVGDTHLWIVWHGLQDLKYYRKRMTRFCSEFGFESLPDEKCIRKFATEDDYSLRGEVFSAHQKCKSGNEKMIYYIGSRFRLPQNFTDYIYLSQICQAECVGDATEHWRRNKGRCNGSLYWQFNDCWPVCSWASVDYYGNYKALQYRSKHFFKSLDISICDSKKEVSIHLVNDLLSKANVDVRARLMTFDGRTVLDDSYTIEIQKNVVQNVASYPTRALKQLANLKECVFVAELIENGVVTAQKTVLFGKEKNLALPKVDIRADVKEEGVNAVIRLKSDKFARFVRLQTAAEKPLSDNYFDMLPNVEYTVLQPMGECCIEEIKDSLDIMDASKICPSSSRLTDGFKRLMIFLKPLNLFNWFYYKLIN